MPRRRRNPAAVAVPVIGYALEHPFISLAAAGIVWWILSPKQVQQIGAQYGVSGIPNPPAWAATQLGGTPSAAPAKSP